MFEIDFGEDGKIRMSGRLDAASAPDAQEFLDKVTDGCIVDMGDLEYVSSAGLGVLLKTHKRLMGAGDGVSLINVSSHINNIFRYSGFDKLFTITTVAD